MTQANFLQPLAVNILPSLILSITHENFVQLAQINRDLQLERTATGELIVMPPTGSETGNRNLDIAGQLWLWNRQNQLGIAFDLPNGADRSPDASWIRQERWDLLTQEEQEIFAPICPDFVLELRSKNDALDKLQAKMIEYIENGASLGWLIDRKNKTVEIYRQNHDVELLNHPLILSGEDILLGFMLDLTEVWN
jgi:Uma2 family endonuclease